MFWIALPRKMIGNDDKITLVVLMIAIALGNNLEWGGPDKLQVDTNSYRLTREYNVAISPTASTFTLWGPMFLSVLMTCLSLFGWANPLYIISRNYTPQYENQVMTFAITVSVCDMGYIALVHYTDSLWLPLALQFILWRIVSQFYETIHKTDTRFFFQLAISLIYVWSSWELSFVICAQFQLSATISYMLLAVIFSYITIQSIQKRDWMVGAAVAYILAGICQANL